MKSFGRHFLMAAWLLAASPAIAQAPPPHGTATAAFGTAASAEAGQSAVPAAIVDGHVIPLSSVTAACLRSSRARVVDQLVQSYVVERECRRRGIVVSKHAIDARVALLREAAAPQTLEQLIAAHHSTLAEVREDFRREIARTLLVADQVPAPPMVRCQAVAVRFRPLGTPVSIAGTSRTEEEADAVLAKCREQLVLGQPLPSGAEESDLGILYSGRQEIDPALISAGQALEKSAAVPGSPGLPVLVKTWNSVNLLRAVSTSKAHDPTENALYADALSAYREQQAQFLAPALVVGLIAKSQIKFAAEADLAPPDGGPIPKAAAVVDDHVIPAQTVISACLAADGPRITAVFVQNYVVDEECRRRGIQVSEAEIDRRVETLKRLLAPNTLDEGLTMHHLTLAALRADFKQDIERVRLVSDQVTPSPMVRCRLTEIPAPPAAQNAAQTAATVQRQVQAGTPFAALAARYPASEMPAGRDTIIFYAGMHNMDTAVLHAALALHRGETSAAPIKTAMSYCLLQAVSTSLSHDKGEDAQYQGAAAADTEQQAQPLVPQAVAALVKKSKVVYYVHN